jgi:hypothetical protein
MLSKIATGFSRLPNSAVTLSNIKFNNNLIKVEPNGLYDASLTWLPNSPTKLELTYTLDEAIFKNKIPNVEGDKFFIQIKSSCRATRKQFGQSIQELKMFGQLSLTMPSWSIYGSVRIHVEIFVKLADQQELRPLNSANVNYACIHNQFIDIKLDGDQGRISIFASDFSKTNYKDALWNVNLDLPKDLATWVDLDLPEVLSINVNQNMDNEQLNSPLVLSLLLTDLIMLTLAKFMDNDEALALLDSNEARGTWLKFARNYFELLFNGEPFPNIMWHADKESIQRKVQSISVGLVNRSHKKILSELGHYD